MENLDNESERLVPKKIWDNYLKKYEDKYLLFYDDAGIWQIKCKNGEIQLYNFRDKILVFLGNFSKPHQITYLKKKLPDSCMILDEGVLEIYIIFNESLLDSVSDIFKCYRKRNISEEEKEKRRERLEEIRKN
jgi:hypothetical protein